MASSSDDDFGDLDLLLGGEERVGSLEEISNFTNSNSVLANANVLTARLRKWMKKKNLTSNKIKFFKNRKALQHQGARIFKKMEQWYVKSNG